MDQVLIAELYQNIIEESKQVGVLYHTSNVKSARNILKTNTLLAKSSVENDSLYGAYRKGKSLPPSISFTRNKRGQFYRFENVKFIIDAVKN